MSGVEEVEALRRGGDGAVHNAVHGVDEEDDIENQPQHRDDQPDDGHDAALAVARQVKARAAAREGREHESGDAELDADEKRDEGTDAADEGDDGKRLCGSGDRALRLGGGRDDVLLRIIILHEGDLLSDRWVRGGYRATVASRPDRPAPAWSLLRFRAFRLLPGPPAGYPAAGRIP